ncbi:MAG: ATP-binding protein, partial [Verrucomicrobiota bacterium]
LLMVGILVAAIWLLLRLYLPLYRLNDMIRRVRAGEKVQAWEITGPTLIRQSARLLSELSDDFIRLRHAKVNAEIELESVLSSIEEGVMVVGVDGEIKLANESFNRLFTLDLELVGTRLRDQIQVFEVNDVVTHALESGEEQGDFISFPLTHDGKLSTRSYRLNGTPMKDEQGAVFGCLLVVADFTKLKEMESVERQMVASVSHELRTPLAVFKGYLEALIDQEKNGKKETRRILDVLSRHSNRLNQLVEDLLILSRVEARALSPIFEPVNISQFLNRVIEDAGHFLKPEIQLKTEIETGIEVIHMDPFRMEQVFYNLIDNAQRHSESSSAIRIGVKRDLASGSYHFYVKDEGMGISSDKLPLIFNRFYRVDRARSRERGGTGLGLTIVREIMRAHGGDAWAESDLGVGTNIWFSLPDRTPRQDDADK